MAQALAERLPKSVHLRGDVVRRMIVSGQAAMTVQLSAEAERQLWLRYRRSETPRIGYWLDSSDLTNSETVEHIMRNLPQTFVTPAAPPQTRDGTAPL